MRPRKRRPPPPGRGLATAHIVYDQADSAPSDRARRRPFDGPVVADLAAVTNPGIAQLDARWAAAVLAGGARNAAELRGWLEMAGLLAESWPAPRGTGGRA